MPPQNIPLMCICTFSIFFKNKKTEKTNRLLKASSNCFFCFISVLYQNIQTHRLVSTYLLQIYCITETYLCQDFFNYLTVTLLFAVLPLYVLMVMYAVPFPTALIVALLLLPLVTVATCLFELLHCKLDAFA